MNDVTEPASFWDNIAERYAARPVGDPDAYAHTLERVRAHLSPDDRVLELGCGTGSTALALADAVEHITATDFAPGMIEIARRKGGVAGARNVEFQTAEADAPIPGTWNAVLAFNLLHLLPDPARAVRQARATLAPGGLLISKTVCLGGLRGVLFRPLVFVMRLIGRAPFVRFFSVDALERMIEAEGFEIIETGTFPTSPPARFIVARKL